MVQDRPHDARRDDLAQVDRSPTRCPYCHDSIQPVDLERAVVCGQCLARHHADCWDGRCGACSATVGLGRLDVGVVAGDATAPYERVKRALNLAFLAGFLLCMVAAFAGAAIFGPGDVDRAPQPGELPLGMIPMLVASFVTALIALPMIAVNSFDAFVRRSRDPATSALAPLLALAGAVTGGFTALGYYARWGWQPLPRAPQTRPVTKEK